MFRVLFLCTGNSARSQIAEALLTHKGAGRFQGESAGADPAERVNPYMIEVLRENGIEWKGHPPRGLAGLDREAWDVVITVCDAARESCPIFPDRTPVAHWGMPDPAAVRGNAAVKRAAFAETFRLINRHIESLVALPVDELDREVLGQAIAHSLRPPYIRAMTVSAKPTATPAGQSVGTPTVWLDGKWYDRATATISVYDHGLLYGDGVFEGIRVYGGKIFRLSEHLDRLYDSAKAIWLTIPMTKDEMTSITREAVRRSGIQEAYIRHVVTRGVGDLGLDPRKCPKPSIIIIVDTIKLWPEQVYETGLNVITAGTPIPHRESLSPRVKSLNYLAHILAKVEGIHAGADEVLMLDSDGHVAEGSGQNVFVVKNGVLRTLPAYAGILKGVTRDVVLELAHQAGYVVEQTILNRYDVYTADEAFFTGTASEIVGIRQLDGRVIGSGKAGPVTRDLRARFQALVRS